MSDQFDEGPMQRAEQGIPAGDRIDTRKTPDQSRSYNSVVHTGAPGLFAQDTTTLGEPPVDPTRTLNQALTDPGNIGETGTGDAARLNDTAQVADPHTSILRGRGAHLDEAGPIEDNRNPDGRTPDNPDRPLS